MTVIIVLIIIGIILFLANKPKSSISLSVLNIQVIEIPDYITPKYIVALCYNENTKNYWVIDKKGITRKLSLTEAVKFEETYFLLKREAYQATLKYLQNRIKDFKAEE